MTKVDIIKEILVEKELSAEKAYARSVLEEILEEIEKMDWCDDEQFWNGVNAVGDIIVDKIAEIENTEE